MSEETYYLSSLESERLSPVRKCTVLFRAMSVSGKECIVANVSPVILAQEFGVPELKSVVLAARHEEKDCRRSSASRVLCSCAAS